MTRGEWIASNRSKVLRALLTDECDCEDGMERYIEGPKAGEQWPHGLCGGRGWLPKDGVIRFFGSPDLIAFPVDWLEAEDE